MFGSWAAFGPRMPPFSASEPTLSPAGQGVGDHRSLTLAARFDPGRKLLAERRGVEPVGQFPADSTLASLSGLRTAKQAAMRPSTMSKVKTWTNRPSTL